MEIAEADTIPIIHRLEQVSSDEHVGSLAENLLEALRTNPTVASRIEEVREFTRSEKKRLAMAMREKQLGQLGMCTNDKGQVCNFIIYFQLLKFFTLVFFANNISKLNYIFFTCIILSTF